MDQIWPNFFIVGTQRAGTTSLYEYLREIPQIYMSPVKEPCFFSPNIPSTPYMRFIRDEKEYLELFQNVTDEKAIGEASPFYLWDFESPNLIHDRVPNARIITMLRDPVERAFSSYLMNVNAGLETLSFFDALQRNYHDWKKGLLRYPLYIELGFYNEQVKSYIDRFGCSNIKIILFEDLKNAAPVVSKVIRFLDIESKIPSNTGKIYNSSSKLPRSRFTSEIIKFVFGTQSANRTTHKAYQLLPPSLKQTIVEKVLFKKTPKPQIPKQARMFLENLYREDGIKLEKLLGHPLSWVKSN